MKHLNLASGFLIVLLFFVQVLFLNEVELLAYINPYVYPIILLVLPAETSRLSLLFIGFFLGLGVDLFENSMGTHAFATTLIGYSRPWFVRLVATQGGLEYDDLGLHGLGLRKFLTYGMSALFLHHALLFALDGFSIGFLPFAIWEAFYTSAFSMAFILAGYLLWMPNKKPL